MANEIERKFLVDGDYKPYVIKSTHIIQGYISSVPERSVRIRIKDAQGFITIKGPASADGTTRFEWEKEIPVSEAKDLLKLCEPGIIDKIRNLIKTEKHIFEVDEFFGANQGLVMAEIELSDRNEKFEKPGWLGKEVTGDKRYYNAMLSKNPFKNW